MASDQDENAYLPPHLEYERCCSETSSRAAASMTDASCAQQAAETSRTTSNNNDSQLVFVFVVLVVFGAANVVFNKLQAVPLYNYPNFLNLFGVFLYIPLTWLYIIPVSKYGFFNNAITAEQLALPKRPFMIMGCLDCLATMMQVFASVYLPGPLLILLPQAAIPISMSLSKHLLQHSYRVWQYLGAIIVLLGIMVVLEPMMSHGQAPDYVCEAIDVDRDCTICQVELSKEACLSHRLDVDPAGGWTVDSFEQQLGRLWGNNRTTTIMDDPVFAGIDDTTTEEGEPVCEWIEAASSSGSEEWLTLMWSLVTILSCVPMTLSSIYKEIALGDDVELDPVYLNGWIAIFQFAFSLLLAVPAGLMSSPQVVPSDIPRNIWDGFKCYLGIGSIETGCHPDSMCASHAALFVNVGLLFNMCFNIAMMYVLKFGNASILYLALTIMVPIGNLAFALPFMPTTTTFHVSDLVGLGVIMAGLVLYRFADKNDDSSSSQRILSQVERDRRQHEHNMAHWQLREPLLTGDV